MTKSQLKQLIKECITEITDSDDSDGFTLPPDKPVQSAKSKKFNTGDVVKYNKNPYIDYYIASKPYINPGDGKIAFTIVDVNHDDNEAIANENELKLIKKSGVNVVKSINLRGAIRSEEHTSELQSH